MSKRALVIVLVLAIAGLGVWRYRAGRVDYTKPESVAGAFFGALKTNNVDKASGYWLAESAEQWRVDATARLDQMQSGMQSRFIEDLPDRKSAFTTSVRPGATAGDQTVTGNGISIDLRQVNGKWYVCKAPI